MRLFEIVSVPPFQAILVEAWNAPAHRYFLAYRAAGGFTHIMGHGVVDEFRTFSTPILIGPAHLLGQLYNVGITLGHQRNPEMPLDQGWPPFCVGIKSNDAIRNGWEETLLKAIKKTSANLPESARSEFRTQHHRIKEAEIFGTDAPLLPRQLQRLCSISNAPIAIAFSTGNRITAQKGKLQSVRVASEGTLEQLLHRFSAGISAE